MVALFMVARKIDVRLYANQVVPETPLISNGCLISFNISCKTLSNATGVPRSLIPVTLLGRMASDLTGGTVCGVNFEKVGVTVGVVVGCFVAFQISPEYTEKNLTVLFV